MPIPSALALRAARCPPTRLCWRSTRRRRTRAVPRTPTWWWPSIPAPRAPWPVSRPTASSASPCCPAAGSRRARLPARPGRSPALLPRRSAAGGPGPARAAHRAPASADPMALIAVAADKGSPGVTTSSVALAAVWPRPVLLAECDPAGGDLIYRLPAASGGQLDVRRGLLSLAVAARRGLQPQQVWEHTQKLHGGLDVLAGVTSA